MRIDMSERVKFSDLTEGETFVLSGSQYYMKVKPVNAPADSPGYNTVNLVNGDLTITLAHETVKKVNIVGKIAE